MAIERYACKRYGKQEREAHEILAVAALSLICSPDKQSYKQDDIDYQTCVER